LELQSLFPIQLPLSRDFQPVLGPAQVAAHFHPDLQLEGGASNVDISKFDSFSLIRGGAPLSCELPRFQADHLP
jgi:hypothetical protein